MSVVERPCFLNVEIRTERLEFGEGSNPLLASEKLAIFESLRPSLTFQNGPPSCIIITIINTNSTRQDLKEHTNATESRAAIVKISAHDTTPGHDFSTLDLILSITLKLLSEFLLGFAFCSPTNDP